MGAYPVIPDRWPRFGGETMSDIKQVDVKGWSLVVGQDDEPRVRAVDLGERLGYARPADFRKLVKRLALEGILNDSDFIATVARTKLGHGWRDVLEYHLTQAGALIAISRSDTKMAVVITRQMIEVFLAYQRGALQPVAGVLDLTLVSGPRIGDSYTVKAELMGQCQSVAREIGTSVGRIHGVIRREFKVSSPYFVSMHLWPTVQKSLKDLVKSHELRSLPPHLRLVQGGAHQMKFGAVS